MLSCKVKHILVGHTVTTSINNCACHGRLDDVMECNSVDTPPQRQHWSRQSVQEPLIAFAAHTEDVLRNTSTRHRDTPEFTLACGSPVQFLLHDRSEHAKVYMRGHCN